MILALSYIPESVHLVLLLNCQNYDKYHQKVITVITVLNKKIKITAI